MANYFLTDENGTRRGPLTEQRLQTLAERGTITSLTPLETDTGDTIVAAQIPGLNFKHPSVSTTESMLATTSTSAIPDVGFSEFLTPILITIIWLFTIISTICFCPYMIYLVCSSPISADTKGFGVIAVIAIAIYSLLVERIFLEYFAIQFRIERHLRTMNERFERNEKASKP